MDREALGLQLLICYLSSVESSLLGHVEVIDAELHRLVVHRTTGAISAKLEHRHLSI